MFLPVVICLISLHTAGALAPVLPSPASEPSAVQVVAKEHPTVLSLDLFLSRVEAASPSLEAARQRVNAAQALEATARELPDPMVMFGLRNAGFDWSVGDSPMSQVMASYRQSLPQKGMRDANLMVARSKTQMMDAGVLSSRRMLLLKATVAYAQWEFDFRTQGLFAEITDWMVLMANLEEAHLSEGAGSSASFLKARTQLSLMQDMERSAQRRLESSTVLINTYLDLPLDEAVGIPESGFSRIWPNPDVISLRPPGSHPGFINLDAQEGILEAQEHKAQASKGPMWSVETGMGYREDMDPIVNLMAGVSLPFRSKRRAHAELARIRAARAALRAERQDLSLELKAQGEQALIGLKSALEEMAALEQTILPQARATLDARLASFAEGSVVSAAPMGGMVMGQSDSMALLDDIRFILDLEMRLHKAHRRARHSEAKLDFVLDRRPSGASASPIDSFEKTPSPKQEPTS